MRAFDAPGSSIGQGQPKSQLHLWG